MGCHFTHQCACVTLTFHHWSSERALPSHSLDQQTWGLGRVFVDIKDGKGEARRKSWHFYICFSNLIKVFCTKKKVKPEDAPVAVRTEPCDFSEVYWMWALHHPKHTCTLHPVTPLLDQGYDWISGQSSLLCDRSNLVTMAAGISSDGSQRVTGSSRGLRNNKKKAVAVTFDFRVMGLAGSWRERCEKVSRGHTQPRWSADLEKPTGFTEDIMVQ